MRHNLAFDPACNGWPLQAFISFLPSAPSRHSCLNYDVTPPMTYLEQNPRLTAALQTVCVCAAVEGLILIVLAGILNHSFIAAAVVSAGFLGPVSWWLAPAVYRRLLRASS